MEKTAAHRLLLFASVFVVATCGIVYELIAGTLSSYLLGNSVTHFSLVIGLFLSAMGLGSYLSRFVTTNLVRSFLLIEIWVGIIGGSSALILFAAFALTNTYVPWLIGCCVLTGTLVGLEIPLLIRILREQSGWQLSVSNVLALDYLGALAASLLFPFILLPYLGLVRSCFLFGLLNTCVALAGIKIFSQHVRTKGPLYFAIATAIAMTAGVVTAAKTTSFLEDALYDDEIIWSKSTPYQRLILTHWRDDLRLFIDGNIQFSSIDEYRYHEALVHPLLTTIRNPARVLVIGGGDGLAIRELLKHQLVRKIDLVDLDPAMTELGRKNAALRRLNGNALSHPLVTIFNEDAQRFLEASQTRYDAIIIDLPDPNHESLARLYSQSFYRLVAQHLTPGGAFVTQATSPFYAPDAFWCIFHTVDATTLGGKASPAESLFALPYHALVPSFGDWGFVIGSRTPISPAAMKLSVPTRFLTPELLPTLFVFSADNRPQRPVVNRLDHPVLVRLYERGFSRYNK